VFQLIPKEIWGFFCDIFCDIRKNIYICTNLLTLWEQITQAQSERETAIRSAIERIEPPNRRPDKKKDFKFFRG